MRLLVLSILSSWIALSTVWGEPSLQDTLVFQEQRLKDALQRLELTRAEIKKEQLLMMHKLSAQKDELKQWKAKVAEGEQKKQTRVQQLKEKQQFLDKAEAQLARFVEVQLPDAIASVDEGLSSIDGAGNREEIRQFNLHVEANIWEYQQLLDNSFQLFNKLVSAADDRSKVQTWKGKVVDAKGQWQEGLWLKLGPIHYFSTPDHRQVGQVQEREGRSQWTVWNNDQGQLLRQWFEGTATTIPVDPSLGRWEQTNIDETVQEHLLKGGVWVYPIIGLGMIAVLVGLFKGLMLYTVRMPKVSGIRNIAQALERGRAEDALNLAKRQPKPCREMLVQAVTHHESSSELVEELMFESIMHTQPKFERYLGVIALTAATAPLLGLLGTVTGIIKTFKLMDIFGAGNPKPLITGISEALITTELGLILAIPALILHALLSRRAASLMAKMEQHSVAMLNALIKIKSQRSVE